MTFLRSERYCWHIADHFLFRMATPPTSPTSPSATMVFRQLLDMTECPVCKDVYVDPRVLPCQHTFCLRCIDTVCLQLKPGNGVLCPMCRAQFIIPSPGGVKQLPVHRLVVKLLDVKAPKSRRSRKKSALCDNCSSVEDEPEGAAAIVVVKPTAAAAAVAYCHECQQNLCDGCERSHRRLKALKSHHIVKMSEKPRPITEKLTPVDDTEAAGPKADDSTTTTSIQVVDHAVVSVNVAAAEALPGDTTATTTVVTSSDVPARVAREPLDIPGATAAVTDMTPQAPSRRLESASTIDPRGSVQHSIVGPSNAAIESAPSRNRDISTNTETQAIAASPHQTAPSNNEPVVSSCSSSSSIAPLVTVTRLVHVMASPWGNAPITAVTSLDNRIFLARSNAQQIAVYDADTFRLRGAVSVLFRSGYDGTSACLGLAACSVNNCLYASDYFGDSLYAVELLTGENKFMQWSVAHQPAGVSLTRTHGVLVTCNEMLQEFTDTGLPLRTIALDQDCFIRPRYAAELLSNGVRCYAVSEFTSPGRVSLVDEDGSVTRALFGGSLPAKHASGLAVGNNGSTLLVADLAESRILAIDPTTTSAVEVALPIDGGIRDPFCLWLDESRGRLYVGEYRYKFTVDFTGSRLLVFDEVAFQ